VARRSSRRYRRYGANSNEETEKQFIIRIINEIKNSDEQKTYFYENKDDNSPTMNLVRDGYNNLITETDCSVDILRSKIYNLSNMVNNMVTSGSDLTYVSSVNNPFATLLNDRIKEVDLFLRSKSDNDMTFIRAKIFMNNTLSTIIKSTTIHPKMNLLNSILFKTCISLSDYNDRITNLTINDVHTIYEQLLPSQSNILNKLNINTEDVDFIKKLLIIYITNHPPPTR